MITTNFLIPYLLQNMPPKRLRAVAQADTPSIVNVPNSWAGIMAWVAGRFGGAAVVSTVAVVLMSYVYRDFQERADRQATVLQTQTERVISVLEKQAEVGVINNTAMSQLRTALEDLAKEARFAHNKWQQERPEK